MKKGEKYQRSPYRDPDKAEDLLRKSGFDSKEDVKNTYNLHSVMRKQK